MPEKSNDMVQELHQHFIQKKILNICEQLCLRCLKAAPCFPGDLNNVVKTPALI